MMKRFISLLLVTVFLLASCTTPDGNAGGTTETPVMSGEVTNETEEESKMEETTAHTHSFTESEVEPTADERGHVLKTCSCGHTEKEYTTGIASVDDKLTILFIGNSYTHYNTMPTAIFARLLTAQGIKATVKAITKGGYTLLQHADPDDDYGKQINSYLASNEVDVVFLQEQSARPASSPGYFYDGVRAFKDKLAAEKAEVILYQTWGRKEPHSTLTSNGWTHETMAYKLAAAYEAIAEEMGYHLSQVGSAFLDVYKNHPEINLYADDNTHPSPTGSYLISLCHYARLYGLSPIGVKYNAGLDSGTVKILQEAAHKAIFGESIVPAEYKLKSEGVTSKDYVEEGNLEKIPASGIISTGIKGTNGKISSDAVSTTQLTASQIADLADISYGVSIIGVKDMHRKLSVACDGIWSGGNDYRLSFHFDGKKYDVSGKQDDNEQYSALITYNFGKEVTLDAIGYLSGSMDGFAQAQDVFVSSDGKTWEKIETACYDAIALKKQGGELINLGKILKDSRQKTAAAFTLFDMGGAKAQYVRVGLITGVVVNEWDTNTYELVVYGK